MPGRETHLRAAMYSYAGRLLYKVLEPCIFIPAVLNGGSNRSQAYGKAQRLQQAWFTSGTARKAGGAKTKARRADRWMRARCSRPLKAVSIVFAGRALGSHGRVSRQGESWSDLHIEAPLGKEAQRWTADLAFPSTPRLTLGGPWCAGTGPTALSPSPDSGAATPRPPMCTRRCLPS